MTQEEVFKNLIAHAKEYGFIFPSSEIYDGLSAVYDYGQMGVEMKNNIKKYWWEAMVHLNDNIVGDDAGDGSQLRPYIVMFGEYVKGMDEAKEFVKKADIFVVVGTSLAVYPACNLINHAHREIPKFVIDPEYMPKCDALGYKHIQTEASMGMQMLKAVLKNL